MDCNYSGEICKCVTNKNYFQTLKNVGVWNFHVEWILGIRFCSTGCQRRGESHGGARKKRSMSGSALEELQFLIQKKCLLCSEHTCKKLIRKWYWATVYRINNSKWMNKLLHRHFLVAGAYSYALKRYYIARTSRDNEKKYDDTHRIFIGLVLVLFFFFFLMV